MARAIPKVTTQRQLSKSRFKQGWFCPTMLDYADKAAYVDVREGDSFLEALKDGGLQVGELARRTYPGGTLVETLDTGRALAETRALLAQDHVVIYEAAVAHGDLVCRVDILVKRGNVLQVMEVKAKSFDPANDRFSAKRATKGEPPRLLSGWVEYVADVGFQALVCRRAFPTATVTPYLVLLDRSRLATIDGMHQHFLLRRDPHGPTLVRVDPDTAQDLGESILTVQDVAREVAALDQATPHKEPFASYVDALAHAFVSGTRIPPNLGPRCRSCAYRPRDPASLPAGQQSGFETCWAQVTGLSRQDLRTKPLVIDGGNLSGLIQRGVYLLEDVREEDVAAHPDGHPGLSASERQWQRVEKVRRRDDTPSIEREALSEAMASWRYPLHMIDFETIAPAIPFHRDRRPYALLAFQFSHHTVDHAGRVAHRTEYLETVPGRFPNFDFVRRLKQALEGDDGTIFRYWTHENTVLSSILAELQGCDDPPADKESLVAWIRSVTQSPEKAESPWCGERNMFDLGWVMRRLHYDPLTEGSNSLKYVLPAVLARSTALQEKYAAPIYGSDAPGGVSSHNFRDHRWVRRDALGRLVNPYKLLPPLFQDFDQKTVERLFGEDEIAEGGAAMTAYARMQFTEMLPAERQAIAGALKKYCELDTFAMVLLYEYWREVLAR